MRRREGVLLPNEIRILGTALALRDEEGPVDRFHAFQLLTHMARQDGGGLMNHSTLYRALRRLEEDKLFESEWDGGAPTDADLVEEEQPTGQRRRYYRLTPAGRDRALATVHEISVDRRPAWAVPLACELARKLDVG